MEAISAFLFLQLPITDGVEAKDFAAFNYSTMFMPSSRNHHPIVLFASVTIYAIQLIQCSLIKHDNHEKLSQCYQRMNKLLIWFI